MPPTQRKVLDGYTIPLLDQFITIVSGTTILAYSLYTFFRLPDDHMLMLTIPFVMYAIFRYLYLIQVQADWRRTGRDPALRPTLTVFHFSVGIGRTGSVLHYLGQILPNINP